jgi:hypothetical protein
MTSEAFNNNSDQKMLLTVFFIYINTKKKEEKKTAIEKIRSININLCRVRYVTFLMI